MKSLMVRVVAHLLRPVVYRLIQEERESHWSPAYLRLVKSGWRDCTEMEGLNHPSSRQA
jgi:hypothetical protein